MSPETFGGYRVLHKIGKGGMADVFLAEDPAIRRQVAIKVLPPEFLRDETFIKRFEREVHTIAALQHPAILPVYAYGQQEGQPYIAMAYMGGGSLADEIRAHPGGLSYERIQRLVERIAEGLDFAHRRGIIHRDFKPSNVLLDEDGNPYIADFGIAKATADTMQLTGSGIVGTPAYMAPEMATSGGLGPCVDVYALGVAIYQMLTGQMPFTADTPIGVLMAHATAPIPDPSQIRTDLPRGVVTVMLGAMAKNPQQRYQTCIELACDLRAALGGADIQRPSVQSTLIESTAWEVEPPAVTQPAPPLPVPTVAVTSAGPMPTPAPAPAPDAPAPPARAGGFPLVPVIGGGLLLVALVLGGIFVLPGLLNAPQATLPAVVAEASPTILPALPPALYAEDFEDGHFEHLEDFYPGDEVWSIVPEAGAESNHVLQGQADNWFNLGLIHHPAVFVMEMRVRQVTTGIVDEWGDFLRIHFRTETGTAQTDTYSLVLDFSHDYVVMAYEIWGSGLWEPLTDHFAILDPGRWYRIRLEVDGDNYRAYLPDQDIELIAQDDRSPGTAIDISSSPGCTFWLDDVVITEGINP